jgi:hypothetical protein
MAALIPKHAKKIMLDALMALGTPKAYLLKDTYVFDVAHEFVSDLGSDILATVALSGVTTDIPVDGTFDCDDITWPAITGSFSGFYLAVDTGTAGTSPLFYYNPDTPIGSLTSSADWTERIDSGADRLFVLAT